jgi:AcrR family transcriptional regulator
VLETATVRRRAAALPPDERRSMIISTTIPLLIEHGDMVTTRQIADAAGIAEGTIFRAFSDKDELLDAVIDAALDPAPLELALATIDVGLPLNEIVARAAELAQRRVVEIWRLVSSLGTRFHDRRKGPMVDSPALARLLEPYRDELAFPSKVAARMLRGIVFAMSHPMMVEKPSSPREIAEVFLHGVSKRSPRRSTAAC